RRLAQQPLRDLSARAAPGGLGQQAQELVELDAPDARAPYPLLELLDYGHGLVGGHAGALQGLYARAPAVRVDLGAAHHLEVAGGEAGHQAANGSSPWRPSSTLKRSLITLPVKPQI